MDGRTKFGVMIIKQAGIGLTIVYVLKIFNEMFLR